MQKQKTKNRKPETMEKWLHSSNYDQKTCASIAKNVMENRGTARAKREGEQPGRQVDVLFLRSVSVLSGAFCMFFEAGKVNWMKRKNKKPPEKSNGLKRIKRVIHLISHTFSKRKQSQSLHDL